VTGCKVFVQRPISRDVPVEEVRKAEILSIRERKLGRNERKERKQRIKAGEKEKEKVIEEESVGETAEDRLEYYIHYVEFNKVCLMIYIRRRRSLLMMNPRYSVSMNGFQLHGSSSLEKSNGQSHHNPPQTARTTTTLKSLGNNHGNPPSFLHPPLPLPQMHPPRQKSRKLRKLATF